MFYISAILFALGGWAAYKGIRNKDKTFGFFGVTLLIAALGTGMISYFALTVIQTYS